MAKKKRKTASISATQPEESTVFVPETIRPAENKLSDSEETTQSISSENFIKPIFSAMLGGLLLSYGLKKRKLRGLVCVMLGGRLLYRALKGTNHQPGLLHFVAKPHTDENAVLLEESVIIPSAPEQIYSFFRDLRNLPHFFDATLPETGERDHVTFHLLSESVGRLEVEAHLVADVQDKMVAWASPPHANISHEGTLYLRPQEQGTLITLMLKFAAPANEVVTLLLGQNPKEQLQKKLSNLPKILLAT